MSAYKAKNRAQLKRNSTADTALFYIQSVNVFSLKIFSKQRFLPVLFKHGFRNVESHTKMLVEVRNCAILQTFFLKLFVGFFLKNIYSVILPCLPNLFINFFLSFSIFLCSFFHFLSSSLLFFFHYIFMETFSPKLLNQFQSLKQIKALFSFPSFFLLPSV